MKKQYHILSGLPRSGSTVLAAILSQNPDLYVSATSPLVGLLHAVKHMYDTAEHIKAYPVEGQLERVLGGVVDSFYAHIDKKVIIDKNRAWPNPENQHTLTLAFGHEPKIICTVRPIADILASFLTLIKKNPNSLSFVDQELQQLHEPLTDENRCKLLMSEQGHVFQSWAVLRAGFTIFPNNILFVEYDNLVTQPQVELKRIYDFLGLPPFEHSLDRIVNPVQENDEQAYSLPGMHTIRPSVGKISKDPKEVLGEELFNAYQGGEFWKETH